jgi:hypothetical protein
MSYSAPPPPPPDGGYGYGGYAAPKTNQKAIWSLVTGIIGVLCCSPLGIVALVLGNGAKKEITVSNGAETGAGLAQAGVVLGIIAIVFLVLSVILFATGAVTFPGSSTNGS